MISTINDKISRMTGDRPPPRVLPSCYNTTYLNPLVRERGGWQKLLGGKVSYPSHLCSEYLEIRPEGELVLVPG